MPYYFLLQVGLGPQEFFFLLFLVFLIVIVYYILNKRRERKMEALIISLTRSRGRVTIDDIIVHTHSTPDKVIKVINKLISNGILKTIEEENRTYYTMA